MSGMGRREFVALLGGAAAAWPLAASAQQTQRMPVVGMLNGQSADSYSHLVEALRLGLKEAGFVEGQNVLVEYRWAEGRDERLPAMAVDLVNREVAALVTGGSVWATISAKAATTTIPIVFTTGSDPVRLAFVPSLNRPGGNVTGVSFLAAQLIPKRVELASQLVAPNATLGFLGRTNEPRYADDHKEVEAAGAALGRKVLFLEITGADGIEAAFAAASRQHIGVLVMPADPLFVSRRSEIVTLAAHHAVPTFYEIREYVTAGGLISYGASLASAYRQVGVYVGRILKGEKVGDLPMMQSTRFELVINLKTAKALGLTVPPSLLARADEVIE
jgi:putative tryptophan/tyrosine transport system substrate-binding protein